MHAMKPDALVRTVLLALVCATATGRVAAKTPEYRPRIDPANFQATVDNAYFPLVPGTTYLLTEKQGKRTSEEEMTVTRDTKLIMGVTCVVVRDVVRTKGKVSEDTFDWYAQDKQGNVWYFGEDTKEYHGDKVSTEGSWEAGVDGAQPGIVMKGKPVIGETYRQEYYRGEAEDMGQVVALDESVTVPYGSFTGCLKTKDWSLLEAGTERKWYAKGIGMIRSESTGKEIATLISVTKP